MSVVRLGTNSKAEETKDLEQRIARISKLTVRQRIAWDRKYSNHLAHLPNHAPEKSPCPISLTNNNRLDCRAYRRISALPASFYRIKGLHTLVPARYSHDTPTLHTRTMR